jgi:sugar lactone lactonase YvrE
MEDNVTPSNESIVEVHTLLTGLGIGESPRWHDGRIWIADWAAGEIISVDLDGHREVIVRVQSVPLCFDFLPDGRLLVVSTTERMLLRRDPDGSLVQHADLTGLCDGAWNDIVVDGRGNAYVNNSGFDLLAGETPAPGIVAVVMTDGTARQVADDVMFPNGMAVTPDGSALIVAESYANRLTAFDIALDGDLSNRRIWAYRDGAAPDGICVDAERAVWYADVPNKQCVRIREGGDVLQIVDLDRGCFACMLGGADRSTLFMVAAEWRGPANMFHGPPSGQVVTATVTVPGAGWP